MPDVRKAIARSKVYKVQLDAIRLELWNLDEKCSKGELSEDEDRYYNALERSEKRVLKNWRLFRAKHNLSNAGVS